MRGRRGRAGEHGSQTVELVSALPLLGLVLLLAWQCIVLARQQIEAQADARELARQTVLCSRAAPPPTLHQVDEGAQGTVLAAAPPGHPELLRIEVRLTPATVLPGVALGADSVLAPRAAVVMRREPC
jgi:hypothetical protein